VHPDDALVREQRARFTWDIEGLAGFENTVDFWYVFTGGRERERVDPILEERIDVAGAVGIGGF